MADDFAKLLQQVETGSEEAAWRLVEKYSPHIYRVVRRKLAPSMRRRFDSADIVQIAWASFLLRDRRLADFKDEKSLLAYLAGMAVNKVLMAARHTFTTQARDPRRERPLGKVEATRLCSGEPTPSEVAEFRDAWQDYLSRQSPRHRRIVELRIAGKTCRAIGKEMQISERTVRRVLKSLSSEVAA